MQKSISILVCCSALSVAFLSNQSEAALSKYSKQDENIKTFSIKPRQYADQNDAVELSEPLKSLVTLANQMMQAQLKRSSVDPMQIISKSGLVLSDSATLVYATGVLSLIMTGIIGTSLIFPGLGKVFVDLKDKHSGVIYEYVTNRVVDMPIVTDFGSMADEILDNAGFDEENYRKETLCYLGNFVSRSFPEFTKGMMDKILTESSFKNLRRKVYLDAFLSGLTERQCIKWRPKFCEKNHNNTD